MIRDLKRATILIKFEHAVVVSDQRGLKMNSFKVGDQVVMGARPSYGIGTIVFIEDSQVDIFFKDKGIAETCPISCIQSALSPINLIRARDFDDPLRFDLRTRANLLRCNEDQSSISNSLIEILPHQIIAAHKVISSPSRRFMLADEVGLGKTIEAGIIIKELVCRGDCNNSLLITPAGLVDQWQEEMDKLGLAYVKYTPDTDAAIKHFWSDFKHVIVSIDTIKLEDRLKRLDDVKGWDVVIFDEAHHLSRKDYKGKPYKSDRYRVAERIHKKARCLLFLTATPHQGDANKFFNLVQLLVPGLYSYEYETQSNRDKLDRFMIRQRKIDVTDEKGNPLFVNRSVASIGFENSVAEVSFFYHLSQYLREGYKLAESINDKHNRALGFLMVTFQKIAASSLFAVKVALLTRLIKLLFLQMTNSEDDQEKSILKQEIITFRKSEYPAYEDEERIFFDAEQEFKKEVSEENPDVSKSIGIPNEVAQLKKLLSELPRDDDTKLVRLIHLVESKLRENPSEKFIVFTEYLKTQDYIVRKLREKYGSHSVAFLRGGNAELKKEAVRAFKGDAQFLVSTQAGGEGINLQHANIVINYDMPWNPMKVEQRIGRAHRYGARKDILVFNLFATGTIEARIYDCLEEKLAEISCTIGNLNEREAFRENILGIVAEDIDFDQIHKEMLVKTINEVDVERRIKEAVCRAQEVYAKLNDLSQGMSKFSIDKYEHLRGNLGLEDVERFILDFVKSEGKRVSKNSDGLFEFIVPDSVSLYRGKKFSNITFDRQTALDGGRLEFFGVGHYLVDAILDKCSGIDYGGRCCQRTISDKTNSGERGIQINYRIRFETQTQQQDVNQIVKMEFVSLFFDENRNYRPDLEPLGKAPGTKDVEQSQFDFASEDYLDFVEKAAEEKIRERVKNSKEDLAIRFPLVVYKYSLESVCLFAIK